MVCFTFFAEDLPWIQLVLHSYNLLNKVLEMLHIVFVPGEPQSSVDEFVVKGMPLVMQEGVPA